MIHETEAQDLMLNHYSIDDGLGSNEVYHVIQDKKGYIWIATGQGVSRYNGYNFKNYNQLNGLPDNTVLELFEDKKGRIWMVTLTGELAYFENDSIKTYAFNDTIFKYNVKKRHPIKKSFYVDSLDNVYIGFYDNNPIKIDHQGKVKQYKSNKPNITVIKKINSGHLIFGCIKRASGMVLKNPVSEQDFHTFELQPGFRSISCEYKNHIIYTDNYLLHYFDEAGNLGTFKFKDHIIWASVDDKGLLWIGFLNNGVKAYDDLNFEEPVHHILNTFSVTSIADDHEGGYWFSTLENGFFHTPSLNFKTLNTDPKKHNESINNLLTYKDKLWFSGGYGKYYTYDLKHLESIFYGNPNQEGFNKMMKLLGDSLLLSETKKGTYLIYKNQLKKLSERYYKDAVRLKNNDIHLFYRRKSKLLKAPYKSITRYSEFYEIYTAQLIKDHIVLLGTDRGLFRLDLRTHKPEKINGHKLLRSRINVILKDNKNNIWIGTQGSGLIKYGDGIEAHYLKEDGLPGNSINSIKIENDTMWVGTNQGIAIAPLINDTLNRSSIINVTKGHGLAANEVHDIDFLKNNVFAATNKGVAWFSKNISSYTSPTYITNFAISGKDTTLLKKYRLKHNQNYIEISFVSLNYQRSTPIEYYYMMEGLDKKWRKTTDLSVNYPSLKPGSYKFKIKAANSYGTFSTCKSDISIVIEKPYYQTYWFFFIVIFSIILIILLIFYTIFKIRIREIHKRNLLEKELNKSRQQALNSQMNPHFIYNSLTSVQNYILNNNAIKSSEYLSKLGGLMRRMLNNSQYSHISLQEEIESLQHYVDMELLRFHYDFTFELEIDKQLTIHEIKVPPLFLQPYVENAIHHGLRIKSGDKTLKVNVFGSNKEIHIHIEDNGIGRKKSREIQNQLRDIEKSHGMQITKNRLELFNKLYKSHFRVNVFDVNPLNNNTGTRVEIIFSPFE